MTLEAAIDRDPSAVPAAVAAWAAAHPSDLHAPIVRDLPPLFLAATFDSAEAVRALVDVGCSVRQVYKGRTPLHAAVEDAAPNAAAALIEAGADPLVPDALGFSALAIAARAGDEELTALLRAATPTLDLAAAVALGELDALPADLRGAIARCPARAWLVHDAVLALATGRATTLALVQRLYDAGAPLGENAQRALEEALQGESTAVVDWLFSHGVRLDAPMEEFALAAASTCMDDMQDVLKKYAAPGAFPDDLPEGEA